MVCWLWPGKEERIIKQEQILVIIFLVVLTLFFPFSNVKAELVETGDKVNVNADDVVYDRKQELAIATGNAYLSTDKIEIWADKMELDLAKNKLYAVGNVTTKTEDGEMDSKSFEYDLKFDEGVFIESEGTIMTAQIKEPLHMKSPKIDYSGDKSEVEQPQFTTCDYDKSHFYFKSNKVVIYPGDKVIAYHTVLWEFSGNVPIFYWPIYIHSLRHDQQLFNLELGHDSNRGWFARTTTNYYFADEYEHPLLQPFERNLGQLYIDYYSELGFAGGFNHFYQVRDDDRGYVYFYIEDDRRNRDLRPWIELEVDRRMRYDRGNRNFNFTYQNHRSNYITNPERHHIFDLDYSQGHEFDNWDTDFDLDYRRNHNYNNYFDLSLDFDRVTADRYDSQISFESDYKHEDEGDNEISNKYDLGFEYGKARESASDEINFESNYSHEDDGEDIIDEYDLGLDYSNDLTSNLELSYDGEYTSVEENYLEREWDYDTGLALNRSGRDYNWEIKTRIEGDQDEIDSYSLPEAEIETSGDTLLPHDYFANFDLRAGGENRYTREEDDIIRRGHWEVDFDDRFNLTDRNNLRVEQRFRQDGYGTGHQHWHYASDYRLDTDILTNWEHQLDYQFEQGAGEAPEGFDLEDHANEIETTLTWSQESSNFSVDTGYDFLAEEYDDLSSRLNYYFAQYYNLGFNYKYDLNTMQHDSFDTSFEIDYEELFYSTELEIDLESSELQQWDNEFKLTLDDLEIGAELDYDFTEQDFDTAKLKIFRDLHCRGISLSYNHVRRETLFTYEIYAFPDSKTEISRDEEEGISFDTEVGGLPDEVDEL